MKGKKARIALGMAICLSASALAGCGAKEGNTEGGSTPESSSAVSGSGTASEGKPVKLTMLGWEIYQQAGMEALAEAYHEEHPNVTIEVQISTWSEYWTKLEAMANSGSLPDIFWMHTNEFSKYADAGMLAELTDLYDEEDKNYFKNNFPDNLVGNFTYDDKIYGIPKDVDTVALVYNKDIFDEAGVAYPDDTWTWDTLVETSETIKEKTGKYGMLADHNEQEGWLNTIYQAGGFYISEDKDEGWF